jgi:glycyl-tRNA synthetase
METYLGPVQDSQSRVYLRGETAQGIFVNFHLVRESARMKIPFGIAQIGKSFRNEITPGNFTFRTREFEQMEIEYFVKPGTDKEWYDYWRKQRFDWYVKYGLSKKNLRLRDHTQDELAHYAVACADVEYKFPFGWSELEGIANRQDFDLKQHAQYSGQDLQYFDEETKEKYFPYVIEPSGGVDRTALAFLVDAYTEVKGGRATTTQAQKEVEVVLRLHKELAPIKIAVLPLVKNKKELVKKAKEIYDKLKFHWPCQYDEVGSIGRRYRRQDEIGTPCCLTIDFDTLKQNDVTVRDRDTMKQKRVKIGELVDYLREWLSS